MKTNQSIALIPGKLPTQIKERITHSCSSTKREGGEEGSAALYWKTVSSSCKRSTFVGWGGGGVCLFFQCIDLHFLNNSPLQQTRQSEPNHISPASPDPTANCLPTCSTCCAPLPLGITYSEVWMRKWGNSFLLFSQLTVSLRWHCNPGGGEEVGRGQLHIWSKFTVKNETETYDLTLMATSSPEYEATLLSCLLCDYIA